MRRLTTSLLAGWLGLILGLVWLPLTALAGGNGITHPAPGASVRGNVEVRGAADHSQFVKWQLDLLPASQAGQAVFLTLGEQSAAPGSALATFDSTQFPDGDYTLRLRVVRSDGNYDEHFTPVAIANRAAPQPAPRPAEQASQRQPAISRAAQLGLPTQSEAGAPILYLTFDDGPNPVLTPQIVDLLDRFDAKATFFVVGAHLNRSPAALLPVAEGGHTIANHTWSHKSLVGMSAEGVAGQLNRTADLVQETVAAIWPAASRISYLRPPYGALDAQTAELVNDLGYRVVTWDIDPRDWRRPGAAAIASAVINRAFPGAIVVLHDGGGGSQQTVDALETILETLSEQGYQFRALPDQPVR